MIFDDKQFKVLAKYDNAFRTAVESRWARNPGRAGLEEIVSVWNAATGNQERVNDGCATCLMRILSDVGRAYMDDKKARLDAAKDKAATGRAKKAANK